ncbi:MAG: T9SS type A sorting domain-containing protein, partial [Tannerella sp.]|nr:T9SS type A sorting domain-containing protein [Tannerella sp.]
YVELGIRIYLAEPKDSVIDYWRKTNGTGAPITEHVNYYPSTNGITADKTTYPHSEYEVIHYKMNGSSHSYFFRKENGDCMDYVEEMGKFIATHSIDHAGGSETIAGQKSLIYPNPADDVVYLGCTRGNVSVYDLAGRLVSDTKFDSGRLDVSALKQGVYILNIRSADKKYTAKLIKK